MDSFVSLWRMHRLQDMIQRSLSVSQLMKLFEMLPPLNAQVQQLQILQAMQSVLGELLPETLSDVHRELAAIGGDGGQQSVSAEKMLSRALRLPADQYFLYKPLACMLQLCLEDVLQIQEVLPRLEPVQMLQLIKLLRTDPFEVLELRQLLTPPRDEMALAAAAAAAAAAVDPSSEPHLSRRRRRTSSSQRNRDGNASSSTAVDDDDDDNANADDPTFVDGEDVADATAFDPVAESPLRLRVVDQPPDKTVYKRNLRPNPSVTLDIVEALEALDEELADSAQLFVAPVLVRCDTLATVAGKLTGHAPLRISPGHLVTFRSLKMMATSRQMQDTLFALRFELRRYTGADEYKVLHWVQTVPIQVLSHSTQLRPTKRVKPIVKEVVPLSGTPSGGTRVAVLGSSFIESPALRVRFDRSDVVTHFHGAGTLICSTPRHEPGIVVVRVSNDGSRWSDSHASYTYEHGAEVSPDTASNQVRADANGSSSLSPSSAAAMLPPSTFESDALLFSKMSGGYGPAVLPGALNYAACAADAGSGDALEALLDAMPSDARQALINRADSRSYAPLHTAAARGELDAVRVLLDRGASPAVRDRSGKTPLHWAIECANADDASAIADELLAANSNVSATQDARGRTPLHLAAALGSAELLAKLCRASAPHVGVNTQDIDGATPLHIAAALDAGAIGALVDAGANIDAADGESDRPLHYAVRERNIDAVRRLLDAGADAAAPNDDGETPLHLAAELGVADAAELLVGWLRASKQRVRCVNARDRAGATPLLAATRGQSVDVVHLLISNGARVNACDSSGFTALHWSAKSGNRSVIEALLRAGARSALPSKGSAGLSPLDTASSAAIKHIMTQIATEVDGIEPTLGAKLGRVDLQPLGNNVLQLTHPFGRIST
jgi:ankyrin repeat protein